MRKLYRVALVMGLMMMTAVSVEAVETSPPDDEITTQVFVMNNYVTDVRIYVEDAQGKLHDMGRLARGSLDRKSTRLNSSHIQKSRMPSSA